MTKEDATVGPTFPCSRRRRAIGSYRAFALWRQRTREFLLLIALLVIAQPAAADEATCGTLRNAYGPYDYRSVTARQLQLVEDYHFTPPVEELKHGKSGLTIGGDIDYTLRAIPNHYRALVAMMNLGFKGKKDPPPGAGFSVECYFDRAIRFRPEDGAVRTIYGIYLFRRAGLRPRTPGAGTAVRPRPRSRRTAPR